MLKLIIIFIILLESNCYSITFPYYKYKSRLSSNKAKIKYSTNLDKINTIIYDKNKYGYLSTLSNNNNIKGFPYGSIVSFSFDKEKKPIFCFSKLSTHTKNLINNSKSSLCITDNNFNGLQDFRFTITGNILKQDNKEEYLKIYEKNHPEQIWIRFEDFDIYRMEEIFEIHYVGGFANAGRIRIKDYYNL